MNHLLIGSNIFIIINFFILTSILWVRKHNSLANIILGLYILLHTFVLSLNLLVYSKHIAPSYYFLCSTPSCLIGPFAFLYCMVLLYGKNEIMRAKMFLHFIPALIVPFLLVLIKKADLPSEFMYEAFLKGSGDFPDLFKIIIVCHIVGYYFYTCIIVKNHYRKSKTLTGAERLKIGWAKNFIYSVTLFIVIFFYLHYISLYYLNTFQTGSSFVSPLLCLFLYFFILRKAIAHSSVFSDREENKTIYPIASEEILNELEIKLQEILKNEKPYLDKELNLKKLSLLINTSPKHLSQLLNSRYEKNFNDFINAYRVEESRQMLLDPEMDNLKLEAIAEAAGFNSRASFYAIFKKLTGETPASFRKEHSSA